jgi:hypothetical protein
MMHRNKMVVAVKCNGNVLREDGEKVYLPFNSEYSILIKNLNSQKALVDVEIDGREAIKGLIIHSFSEVELERFFEMNMDRGYKFKFIEKTESIEKFRGNKVEDGIIRVSFRYEKPNNYVWDYNGPRMRSFFHYDGSGNDFYGSGYINYNSYDINNVACNNLITSHNANGITVEGNDSNQKFEYGCIGDLEDEITVITLQLFGKTENTVINKPLLVKQKIQCKYCGRMWKSNVKFCGECGARLINK